MCQASTRLTSCNNTKVQILTPEELALWPKSWRRMQTSSASTLFTSKKSTSTDWLHCHKSANTDTPAGFFFFAEKLAPQANVLGFDSLNEPNLGMIG
jgi:hypothetical protein